MITECAETQPNPSAIPSSAGDLSEVSGPPLSIGSHGAKLGCSSAGGEMGGAGGIGPSAGREGACYGEK